MNIEKARHLCNAMIYALHISVNIRLQKFCVCSVAMFLHALFQVRVTLSFSVKYMIYMWYSLLGTNAQPPKQAPDHWRMGRRSYSKITGGIQIRGQITDNDSTIPKLV